MIPNLPNALQKYKIPILISAIFLIGTLIFIAVFTIFSFVKSGSPNKQATPSAKKEKVNPTGIAAYSIVGPIKEVNETNRELVVFNTRDGKNYKLFVSSDIPIFELNKQVGFEKFKKDLHVAIYGEKKFDTRVVNKDFSYIIITGSPVPQTSGTLKGDIPKIGGEYTKNSVDLSKIEK